MVYQACGALRNTAVDGSSYTQSIPAIESNRIESYPHLVGLLIGLRTSEHNMQIHRQERSIDVALRLISTHTHPEVVERACSLICNLCSACTQLSLNLIILRAGNVECTNRLLAIVHTYSNIFSGYSTISTRLGCILHFSQCTTYCYSTIGDARSHVSSSNLHQTSYNYPPPLPGHAGDCRTESIPFHFMFHTHDDRNMATVLRERLC